MFHRIFLPQKSHFLSLMTFNFWASEFHPFFIKPRAVAGLLKTHKRNLSTMKLDDSLFRTIFTEELEALWNMFSKHGYELRIVGGAVRDLLSGITPHDLDLASTATPQQMKAMFDEEGVRIFNNKGEIHGTVSARLNDKENFEITTLRTDVSTDGRHAKVEFTTKWEVDAVRRDLTINALYLGFDGTVYDYVGGIEDLNNQRVLFVGNPTKRIQEDYLRILRYFRFFGKIVNDPHSHDRNTLQAIRDEVIGLKKISGERIWSELQRILKGRFIVEILNTMLDVGLGDYLVFGPRKKLDFETLSEVCRLKSKHTFEPATYIGALLPNHEQILEFHSRMKLSNYARNLALFINSKKNESFQSPPENCLRSFQELIVKNIVIREHVIELFRMKDRADLIEQLTAWKEPNMAVSTATLRKIGLKNGKLMSFVLNELKHIWIQSDFQMTRKELIQKIPEISAMYVKKCSKQEQ